MISPNEAVLQCQCTTLPYTNRIVYILAPMKIPSEATVAWAHLCHGNVAVIYGMNWEENLTPWPSPNIKAGSSEFAGKAPQFLNQLKTQIFPTIERAIGLPSEIERDLVGISLSGLFALWAWISNPGFFHNVGIISGSLWYPKFVDWVQGSKLVKQAGKACLSLGKLERTSCNALFNTVESATNQVMAVLKAAGIACTFQWDEGGHKSPLEPRMESTIQRMFQASPS